MRILRYGAVGHEKPGLLDGDGKLRDLSGVVRDVDAATLSPAGLARLAALDVTQLPLVAGEPRIGVPIANVGKMIGIGLNYSDHAAEAGATVPSEPVVFLKATSALQGANDVVVMPQGSTKTDWEVELGVVIGQRASHVSEAAALDFVAGYCVVNDISEREFQLERVGQWTKGKSCDTFGPIGPWLVTKDEIDDPQSLELWLEVNGVVAQRSNTKNMIYGVRFLVSYLSRFFTLHPGDVITTGTPAGVGLGRKPPSFLRAGDVMRVGVQRLGEQRQEVRAWSPV